jgi:hypothetical protein
MERPSFPLSENTGVILTHLKSSANPGNDSEVTS